MLPNFKIDDIYTITRIVERAEALNLFDRISYPRMTMVMDLAATDGSIGMDFDALLAADDFNFAHDMGGIARHVNRKTGQLEDCFLPRFAKQDN